MCAAYPASLTPVLIAMAWVRVRMGFSSPPRSLQTVAQACTSDETGGGERRRPHQPRGGRGAGGRSGVAPAAEASALAQAPLIGQEEQPA